MKTKTHILTTILLGAVLTISLVFLSSCTSEVVAKASKLYMNDPNAATITVMRKSQYTGAASAVKIALDAEVIANLRSGDRIEFQVQPGEHYVAAGGFWGERVIRFDARAKEKYYFYYSFSCNSGDGYNKLEKFTPEKGEKELAMHKYKLLTASK